MQGSLVFALVFVFLLAFASRAWGKRTMANRGTRTPANHTVPVFDAYESHSLLDSLLVQPHATSPLPNNALQERLASSVLNITHEYTTASGLLMNGVAKHLENKINGGTSLEAFLDLINGMDMTYYSDASYDAPKLALEEFKGLINKLLTDPVYSSPHMGTFQKAVECIQSNAKVPKATARKSSADPVVAGKYLSKEDISPLFAMVSFLASLPMTPSSICSKSRVIIRTYLVNTRSSIFQEVNPKRDGPLELMFALRESQATLAMVFEALVDSLKHYFKADLSKELFESKELTLDQYAELFIDEDDQLFRSYWERV